MATYKAKKIMHCGDEIKLGGSDPISYEWECLGYANNSCTVAVDGSEYKEIYAVKLYPGCNSSCSFSFYLLSDSIPECSSCGYFYTGTNNSLYYRKTGNNISLSGSYADGFDIYGKKQVGGGDGQQGYVDFLLVGGGSGGGASKSCGGYGNYGGLGGGGGGVIECIHYPISGKKYSITIGEGGCGSHCCCYAGCRGGNSSFAGFSATGGYGSTSGYKKCCSGTSSGACGTKAAGAGSDGSSTAATFIKKCPQLHECYSCYPSVSYFNIYNAGCGGPGYCSDITGETHAYGGGGGAGGGNLIVGGNDSYCPRDGSYGGCGCDGGGDGGQIYWYGYCNSCQGPWKCKCDGCDATYYGGGGGGGFYGGNGCQGLVVIRYHTDGSDGICAECSYGGCKYTCGEYTIHCFTDLTEANNEFIPIYK